MWKRILTQEWCTKFLCSIQALFYQCFSRWGKWPFTSSTFGYRNVGFNANWQLTRGVSHCSLAIYIKEYLKAKEELWKFKYFTMQKCNLQKKNPLVMISSRHLGIQRILQDIITLHLISSLNTSQNIIIFQKSSYKNWPTTS